jgi:hypothetical protein
MKYFLVLLLLFCNKEELSDEKQSFELNIIELNNYCITYGHDKYLSKFKKYSNNNIECEVITLEEKPLWKNKNPLASLNRKQE